MAQRRTRNVCLSRTVISILIARGNLKLIGLWQVVAALGLVFAHAVAMYKGVLLSATAQPIWGQLRWLGSDLSFSAGACGSAVMLAIVTGIGDTVAVLALRYVVAVVLVIQFLAFIFTMHHITRVLRHRTELIFWYVTVIGAGALIPAVLACVAIPFDLLGLASYAILILTLTGIRIQTPSRNSASAAQSGILMSRVGTCVISGSSHGLRWNPGLGWSIPQPAD
jgi:hypothetical protein